MSFQETKDGSLTYISPIYGAAFHSRHGAILESQYVFIQHGLLDKLGDSPSQLRIFEMGLGSGLNVLLSALFLQKKKSKTYIYFDSIEKHPLDIAKAEQLNYCQQLSTYSNCSDMYSKIHSSRWNEIVSLTEQFQLQKIEGDLLEIELPSNYYDLIYYDAFAPSAQSELWSTEACERMYQILDQDGMLTTYCAQGQFKRNLKAVGFVVEELPGPPGKREMTRAIKT